MRKIKKIVSAVCACVLVAGMMPTSVFAKSAKNENLLVNPGFESEGGWCYNGNATPGQSGSGTMSNNPHSGKHGMFLDGDNNIGKNILTQDVTLPYNGVYTVHAYIATGSSSYCGLLGVRVPNTNEAYTKTDIWSSTSYAAPLKLKPFEAKQGADVQLYMKNGYGWLNGDDFFLGYDFSNVDYNLLEPENDLSDLTLKAPWDGSYILTLEVKATEGASVSINNVKDRFEGDSTKVFTLKAENVKRDDDLHLQFKASGDFDILKKELKLDMSSVENNLPEAKDVSIVSSDSGVYCTGEYLSGTYTFVDPDGDDEGNTRIAWYAADSKDGAYTQIEGQDSKALKLTEDLEGKYVKMGIVPVDLWNKDGKEVFSNLVGPVEVNLVYNSGMEAESRDGNPEGWYWNEKSSNPFVNNKNETRRGFRYAEVKEADVEAFYPASVKKSGNYSFGAWVKSEQDGGILGLRFADSKEIIKEIALTSTEGQYKHITADDVALESGRKVEIFLKGTEGCGTVKADDFMIVRKGAAAGEFTSVLGFKADNQFGVAEIDQTNHTITFKVPYKTDITNMKAAVQVSENATASVDFAAGVDFTNPVEFIVKNGDKTSPKWTVKCVVGQRTVQITSDNKTLEETFNWAVNKTDQFVMTGKTGVLNKSESNPRGTGTAKYIPSYWAGYYDRTAFYGRDFVHQAVGGQLVGLTEENFNMFKTFAKNATEEQKWYAPWAFNFDGSIYSLDYKSPTNFVREVPAQFELVEKAYKQYQWSGDERYINDPDLWNFYTKVMTDFVEMHDTNGNGVAEGTGGGIFQGTCSYNERGGEPLLEAGDSIGSQYQATLAYAGMLEARGEKDEAAKWFQKAADLKKYFNEEWSVKVGSENTYVRALGTDNMTKYTGWGKENSWFMPMKQITAPGERTDGYLDMISERLGDGIGSNSSAPNNIEAYTYLPDTFFPYNRNEEAWKWMQYIASVKDNPHERPSQGTNGDYPEISFTWVSSTIEGLMGVQADAAKNMVTTAAHLPKEIGFIDATSIHFADHYLDVRHDGLTKTTVHNEAEKTLNWEAQFYGEYDYILCNGKYIPAKKKQVNGVTVSFANITVNANETTTAEAVNEENVVCEVTLDKTELSLQVGKTAELKATVTPFDATVTWSSSDKAIATVNEKGVVTAVKEGTATITASLENGKTAKCVVTVTAPATQKGADYSKVDAALAEVSKLNPNNYKDISAVVKAVNAVDRTLDSSKQDVVDGYAEAIVNALKKLEFKDADYSRVDTAIAKANKLDSKKYENFSAVKDAVDAVVRGKNITEQDTVDGYAEAIENALNALKALNQKEDSTVPKTGDANYLAVFAAMIASAGAALCLQKKKKFAR